MNYPVSYRGAAAVYRRGIQSTTAPSEWGGPVGAALFEAFQQGLDATLELLRQWLNAPVPGEAVYDENYSRLIDRDHFPVFGGDTLDVSRGFVPALVGFHQTVPPCVTGLQDKGFFLGPLSCGAIASGGIAAGPSANTVTRKVTIDLAGRLRWNDTWARNVGYSGPFTATGYTVSPLAAVDQSGAEEDAPPLLVPTAWDLPIRLPGEVEVSVIGWPFAQQRSPAVPRDLAPPRVRPLAPGERQVTKIDHDGHVVTRLIADTFGFPPSRGTKELKMRTLRTLMVFKSAYGAVTEIKDFAQALWKGLPKQFRKKYGKGGPTAVQMLQDVYEAWDKLNSNDVKNMLKNLISNEMQDFMYGLFGQFNQKVSNEFFQHADAPFGFQTAQQVGSSRGKHNSPHLDEKRLRDLVGKAVDYAWGDGFEGRPEIMRLSHDKRGKPGHFYQR